MIDVHASEEEASLLPGIQACEHQHYGHLTWLESINIKPITHNTRNIHINNTEIIYIQHKKLEVQQFLVGSISPQLE